jgi:hypothetical protein
MLELALKKPLSLEMVLESSFLLELVFLFE